MTGETAEVHINQLLLASSAADNEAAECAEEAAPDTAFSSELYQDACLHEQGSCTQSIINTIYHSVASRIGK